MENDLLWACPQCGTDMLHGKSVLLHHWHCPGCGFDWVSGEALAAFLPTVGAFEKLRRTAASGEATTRSLKCPSCRITSFRLVKAEDVVVDVCPQCVGVALDPGELRTFKSIRHTPATCAMDAIDAVSGVDALASILSLFLQADVGRLSGLSLFATIETQGSRGASITLIPFALVIAVLGGPVLSAMKQELVAKDQGVMLEGHGGTPDQLNTMSLAGTRFLTSFAAAH